MREMRLDPTSLRGNIESLIGAVEIPVGVAGPLLIKGGAGSEEVFAPIATSEGALVSSINRGCRALQMSGGVTARTLKQRMVRAPFFDCGTLLNCLALKSWLERKQGEIQRKVREYSNHAVLLQLEYRVIAPCLHVRFIFETGDASGQNMTTVCVWNTSNWLIKEFEKENPGVIRHFMIDGNLSTDKKASSLSAISGRGHEVVAEALLPESVIRRVLHSTADDMARFFVQCQSTGVLTGVHGLNINAANVIAALFTATGQDIACVHESSTAQLHFERRPEGLYVSILLPNLVIGTVGGGVGLAMQKQLLDMMGCYGPKKSQRFAETIAAYVLSLEISTGAALAGGQFATAHERLGRKKVSNWLEKADLTPTFFNHLLHRPEEWGPVVEANPIPSEDSGSLVMELTSQISRRPCGLWGYQVRYADRLASEKVFVKAKVTDQELLLAFEIMAGIHSPGLGELLHENRKDNPFNRFHIREIKIAELQDEPLRALTPKTLGTITNEKREISILAQEYLENLELFNSAEQRVRWTRPYLEAAISQISRMHAHFIPKAQSLRGEEWMFIMDEDRVWRLSEVHFELARQLQVGGYDWFTDEDLEFHRHSIGVLANAWSEVEKMPQTLIHGDFNPRNIGFRPQEPGKDLELVAYDWELATVHLPQRDVAELLSFTLLESTTDQEILEWVEWHRQSFAAQSGLATDPEQWRLGYVYALMDLILHRFPIYSVAQNFRQVHFLKPSYRMARRILSVLSKGNLL